MSTPVDETRQLAAGKEVALLAALGITPPDGNKHIRCPMPYRHRNGDQNPSWRFNFDTGKWHCSCADKRGGDILDLVQLLGRASNLIDACNWVRNEIGFPRIGQNNRETPEQCKQHEERLAAARARNETMFLELQEQRQRYATKQRRKSLALWRRSVPAVGTIAARYLNSRGINCPLLDTIRFLPAAPDSGYHPSMIVPFGILASGADGKMNASEAGLGGVHLTFLKRDGSGKEKDQEGRSKIRLGVGHNLPLVVALPAEGVPSDTLLITEGIEDALSGHQVAGCAAWAAGGACFLPGLSEHVPEYVKTVLIQQDDNRAGRESSAQLAAVLAARGVSVRISEAVGDTDINSVLQTKGNDGVRNYLAKSSAYCAPAEAGGIELSARDLQALSAADRKPEQSMLAKVEELRQHLPKKTTIQLDDTLKAGTGIYSVTLDMLKYGLTPDETFAVLEASAIAEPLVKNGGLQAEVRRMVNIYARQQKQRDENVRLARDGPGDPRITPIMTLSDMLKDMVWLSAGRYVGRKRDKRVMKAEDFAAHLASSKTLLPAKKEGQEPKAVSTFALWRENADRLTVDAQTWKPQAPEFCELPVPATNGGMHGFNTWAGLNSYTPPDNWFELSAPLREHVDYLCPVPSERDHFTMWLAHIFQCPGTLPHHYFCHIATMHGVGRNWLAGVLVRMLRRYVAPDLDMEAMLEGKFNDQMSKKLLLIFNEVYEPGGISRHRRGAKLRELVNPEYRHVNPKCERQHAEYNFARWLCFSNYEEAIAFDKNDNRLAIIENPDWKQSPAYYDRLYAVHNDADFVASCRHWLQTVDISTFNPGRHTAMNDIKRRSLEAQASPVDLIIQEFIHEWPGAWIGQKTLREQVGNLFRDVEGRDIDDNAFRSSLKHAGLSVTAKTYKVDGKTSRMAAIKGRSTTIEIEASPPSLVTQNERDWLKRYRHQ